MQPRRLFGLFVVLERPSCARSVIPPQAFFVLERRSCARSVIPPQVLSYAPHETHASQIEVCVERGVPAITFSMARSAARPGPFVDEMGCLSRVHVDVSVCRRIGVCTRMH